MVSHDGGAPVYFRSFDEAATALARLGEGPASEQTDNSSPFALVVCIDGNTTHHYFATVDERLAFRRGVELAATSRVVFHQTDSHPC